MFGVIRIMENKSLELLKKEVLDNLVVNDTVICDICDKIIMIAKECKDWQSVAFGHIWRADHYFYVHSDLDTMGKELDFAEHYINANQPSEVLEKFYVMKQVFFESISDTRKSFQMSLKALEVSETLQMEYRIAANYGNIANHFTKFDCYEDALVYTEKAIAMIHSLPTAKPRVLRILLWNMMTLYLHADETEKLLPLLKELEALPIEEGSLKIYLDNAYLLYYATIKDFENVEYFYNKLIKEGLLDFANHLYLIEFLTYQFHAMISIGHKQRAQEIINHLDTIILKKEYGPRLDLCKLKIQHCEALGGAKQLDSLYQEFYELYLKVEKQNRMIKIEGLHSKIKLNSSKHAYSQSEKKLEQLEALVIIDELTHVYNRHYLTIKENELLSQKQRVSIGIAIFDIDYFKEYNDYYGHQAGDKILQQVAACLQEQSLDQMAVVRYGGDEFVCLAWDMNIKVMKKFINDVRRELKEKKLEHERSMCSQYITLSIGYGCSIVHKKADMMALFDRVDDALYDAKRAGRDQSKAQLIAE